MLFHGNNLKAQAGIMVFCLAVWNGVVLMNRRLNAESDFQKKRFEKLTSFQESKNKEEINEIH